MHPSYYAVKRGLIRPGQESPPLSRDQVGEKQGENPRHCRMAAGVRKTAPTPQAGLDGLIPAKGPLAGEAFFGGSDRFTAVIINTEKYFGSLRRQRVGERRNIPEKFIIIRPGLRVGPGAIRFSAPGLPVQQRFEILLVFRGARLRRSRHRRNRLRRSYIVVIRPDKMGQVKFCLTAAGQKDGGRNREKELFNPHNGSPPAHSARSASAGLRLAATQAG